MIHNVIGPIEGWNNVETRMAREAKNKVIFHECTVSEVDGYDGKYLRIRHSVASPSIVLCKSSFQWLLHVCKFQTDVQGKENWHKLLLSYRTLKRLLEILTIPST